MAAQNGTIVLVGRSGKTYSVDFYAPDSVATLLTFNSSGNAVATSNTTYRAPEDMIISDVVLATAPTATSATFTANGNVVAGGVLRWANQLAALPNRYRLAIPIARGDFLGAIQA